MEERVANPDRIADQPGRNGDQHANQEGVEHVLFFGTHFPFDTDEQTNRKGWRDHIDQRGILARGGEAREQSRCQAAPVDVNGFVTSSIASVA